MILVLAQQVADPQGLNWQQFGAFGLVCACLVIAIVWLVKQLARERAAKDALYDRIVELGQTIAPLLERAARALEHTDGGGR